MIDDKRLCPNGLHFWTLRGACEYCEVDIEDYIEILEREIHSQHKEIIKMRNLLNITSLEQYESNNRMRPK